MQTKIWATRMQYFSKEGQDRFAHILIGNKGTFLDLGCNHPYAGNNTAALEQLGWSGIVVDYQPRWVSLNQKARSAQVLQSDTASPNFITDLIEIAPDLAFDYISVDVDEASIETLRLLIDSDVTFKCMTFEHSLFEDPNQKNFSKSILSEKGYTILFEDVLCDLSHDGYMCAQPFEDWWIDPTAFPESLLEIKGSSMLHNNIIEKLVAWRTSLHRRSVFDE